jgi:hypothetical protein
MAQSQAEFSAAFIALRGVLAKPAGTLVVQTDTAEFYSLTGRIASPFPQHKGKPMWFGSVKLVYRPINNLNK